MSDSLSAGDINAIVSIAALAAQADGIQTESERNAIVTAATRLGAKGLDATVRTPTGGSEQLKGFAGSLSSEASRRAAFEVAAAVCHADGEPNPSEVFFLHQLSDYLKVDPAVSGDVRNTTAEAAAVTQATTKKVEGSIDDFVLDQSIITAACELLPDRLATMAILPLQLRMVHQIGQRHGQQMDISQAKDLAGALGLGAAAQVMESVVRKVLGGVGGSLLGGLLGGAAGTAGGAAVTFAATYALGQAAEQYYAQGRKLSTSDLKNIFVRVQGEAKDLFPKVEQRVKTFASGNSLQSIVQQIKNGTLKRA